MRANPGIQPLLALLALAPLGCATGGASMLPQSGAILPSYPYAAPGLLAQAAQPGTAPYPAQPSARSPYGQAQPAYPENPQGNPQGNPAEDDRGPYQQELGRFRRREIDQAPEDRPAFVATSRGAGRRLHDGFYARFAASVGYGRLAGSTEPFGYSVDDQAFEEPGFDGAASGFAYSTQLALGAAVVPGVVIAVGASSVTLPDATASKPVEGLPDYAYAISQSVQVGPLLEFYPDPNAGFHFGGGVGVAGIIVGQADPVVGPRARTHTSLGWGFSLGAGYEWWVADEWSTGLFLRLEYVRATGDDPRNNSWTHNLWSPSVGLGLTYN